MWTWIGSSQGARSPHRAGFARLTLQAIAVMALMGPGIAVTQAQASTQSQGQAGSASAYPAQSPAEFNLRIPAGGQLFSSSSDEQTAALVIPARPEDSAPMPAAGAQYGWGPQYGRAVYRSNGSNVDGSLKAIFYIGGGATMPMKNTSQYLTPNFSFQTGIGPRFNRHLALPIEFDWDEFGITATALDNQIAIYDYIFGNNSVKYLLNGNNHIWSFSVQPTLSLHDGEIMETYIKAGAGFYHKVTDFTLPAGPCDFYCATFNLDQYTSNAPGYDGGLGFAFRLASDSHMKLYLEAKYVYIDNRARTGIVNTPASLATVTSTTTNFFPANSDRTTYIPMTIGFRW
ncbi:MAG: hypothetical protein ACLGQX_08705 [Acidobacteriota bacterium]